MSGVINSVLAIDDDENMREVFQEYLEESVSDVYTAGNIKDAKAYLEDINFEIILLDINLKGENGGEIIKYLKENDTPNRETPILIVSGIMNDDFIERNQTKIELLEKPFTQDSLISKIKQMIKANTPVPDDDFDDDDALDDTELDDNLKDILKKG